MWNNWICSFISFNGLVYINYYDEEDLCKTDGDGIVAELNGENYKCKYFDEKGNTHALIAKYSDLGKKQYNYNTDLIATITTALSDGCAFTDSLPSTALSISNYKSLCSAKETFSPSDIGLTDTSSCKNIYLMNSDIYKSISNKDKSDRFLTTLILSLFVCLANIGLALFGFLLFRTSGDF